VAWWIWVLVGLALAGAELFVGGLYLIFVGIGAIFVGLASLANLTDPPWMQWPTFVVASAILILYLRKKVLRIMQEEEGSGRSAQ
jgi:membrane protein implicated in regulation of membrane protease activity